MLYKKILWGIFFFFIVCPIYGSYVFISSIPTGAKVSIITDDNKLKFIGRTPLKTTNFSKSTKIVLEKAQYYTQTNTVSRSTSVQSINYSLRSFSFDIQVLDEPDNATVTANREVYAYLKDPLTLPYGNYSFNKDKNNNFNIDYRSPYTPYIAFFSSVTILSTIFAVTGGVLANQAFNDFKTAGNENELLSSINRVATWDTVMWASVGVGTGALIGTIITASLDARDKKRIKRFNGMNSPSKTSTYFSEFQEILVLSTVPDSDVLKKMNTFIKKYSTDNSTLLPDIYMRRAAIFVQRGNNAAAIKDLKKVIEEYPSRSTYELASKLLADTYVLLKNYQSAIAYYDEVIKVRQTYTFEEVQRVRLDAFYKLAQKNKVFKDKFLEENLDNISVELRLKVQKQQQEFR